MIRKSSERWGELGHVRMFESSSTFIVSHCGMHNLYGVLSFAYFMLRALASCWNKENLDTLSKILLVGWYSEEVGSCVLDPLQLQPCIRI